jgi:hypothetical protein
MLSEAKYLYVTIRDVNLDIEEEFVKWTGEEHIPDLLAVPGVIRVLRYVSYNGSSPKHMTVYELERADVPQSEAWTRAVTTKRTDYMVARLQGKARNVFELVAIVEPQLATRKG